MEEFIGAMVGNDLTTVRKLLKHEPGLATRAFDAPRLYKSGIFHWIYTGDTVLHLAAAGHRHAIAGILLAAGADANAARNHRRGAPLHYAADGNPGARYWCANDQTKTLRALLDAGTAIDARDKNGATPLHRAVRTRCTAAVQCLLDAGADPKAANESGSTPFHLAVQNTGRGGSGTDAAIQAQEEIIGIFLALGLSPDLKTCTGKSIRDCARTPCIRALLG